MLIMFSWWGMVDNFTQRLTLPSSNLAIPRVWLYLLVAVFSVSTNAQTVNFLYLEQKLPPRAVLSNLFAEPSDSGLRGAELAIADSNTTGRFLNQQYQMSSVVDVDAKVLLEKALDAIASNPNTLILANMPSPALKALLHDPRIFQQTIVFNIADKANALRTSDCATGLLHTLPDRAMLADALVQFLIRKGWKKWLLISQENSNDQEYVASLQRSAKRFGGKIIDQRSWTFQTDLRRTAQAELPLFTQARDYDVVLVADEVGDVGEYVLYNTWLPRPVAGTQGLQAVAWHRVIEQWGAVQLQNRFQALTGRDMNSTDYAAWLAVRSVAEAATRTGSETPNQLYAYMLSDDFELAAFKGRKLNYRGWNGQLRQPIPLIHPRSLVSQSPQEGFLHPLTDLDTLGFEAPEVNCQFNTTLKNNS